MTPDHSTAPTVCVVGCGRWMRRDDQAGLLVVRSLQRMGLADARFLLTESPAADLLTVLPGVGLLVVVDAARKRPGCAPGNWLRFRYREAPDGLRRRASSDSHSLSIDFAMDLARAMGLLPAEVWVYAVVGGAWGYGEQLTPELQRTVRALVQRIPDDIRAWQERKKAAHA